MAGAGAMAVAVVFWMTRDTCGSARPCVGVEDRVLVLRIGMLLLAIGAAFALDDPTEDTTAHLPVARWVRRGLRVALVAPAVAVAWMVLVAVALRESTDRAPFPTHALSVELAATVVIGLAVCALAAPLAPERMGGLVTGPVLIVMFVVGFALPGRLSPFPQEPADPRWATVQAGWRWAVIGGVVALAFACRDPWRHGRSLSLLWRDRGNRSHIENSPSNV